MATVVIKVDGVDITADVVFSQTLFRCVSDGQAGTATVVVRDATQTYTTSDFRMGMTLELIIDGMRHWDGWVFVTRRTWPLPADDTSVPTAVDRIWKVEGLSRDVLFQKRILYKLANPTDDSGLRTWAADTTDKVALDYVMDNYVDLTGDGLTIDIDEVASPGPFEEFTLGYVGAPLGVAFDDAAKITGGVFYIGPGRVLRYHDDITPTAPFVLSDRPTGAQVGYREYEIATDFSLGATEAFIWGAGRGSDEPVFANYSENPGNIVGTWQYGELFIGAWRQRTVDRRARTYIKGSPNHRRGHADPMPTITCTIFEPGMRAGDVVTFENELYGYTKDLPVRAMTITFPAPETARFALELSLKVDTPFGVPDPWDYHRKRIRVPEIPKPPPVDPFPTPSVEITYYMTGTVYDTYGPFDGLTSTNSEGSSGWVARIDGMTGERLIWFFDLADEPTEWSECYFIQADSTGVYVLAQGGPTPYSGATTKSKIRKFDSDGNLLWEWVSSDGDPLSFGLDGGVILWDGGHAGALDASDGSVIWTAASAGGYSETGAIRAPDQGGLPALWSLDFHDGFIHLQLLGSTGLIDEWPLFLVDAADMFMPTTDRTVFYVWEPGAIVVYRVEADGISDPTVTLMDANPSFNTSVGLSMDPETHDIFGHEPSSYVPDDPIDVHAYTIDGDSKWDAVDLQGQHDFNGIFGNARARGGSGSSSGSLEVVGGRTQSETFFTEDIWSLTTFLPTGWTPAADDFLICFLAWGIASGGDLTDLSDQIVTAMEALGFEHSTPLSSITSFDGVLETGAVFWQVLTGDPSWILDEPSAPRFAIDSIQPGASVLMWFGSSVEVLRNVYVSGGLATVEVSGVVSGDPPSLDQSGYDSGALVRHYAAAIGVGGDLTAPSGYMAVDPSGSAYAFYAYDSTDDEIGAFAKTDTNHAEDPGTTSGDMSWTVRVRGRSSGPGGIYMQVAYHNEVVGSTSYGVRYGQQMFAPDDVWPSGISQPPARYPDELAHFFTYDAFPPGGAAEDNAIRIASPAHSGGVRSGGVLGRVFFGCRRVTSSGAYTWQRLDEVPPIEPFVPQQAMFWGILPHASTVGTVTQNSGTSSTPTATSKSISAPSGEGNYIIVSAAIAANTTLTPPSGYTLGGSAVMTSGADGTDATLAWAWRLVDHTVTTTGAPAWTAGASGSWWCGLQTVRSTQYPLGATSIDDYLYGVDLTAFDQASGVVVFSQSFGGSENGGQLNGTFVSTSAGDGVVATGGIGRFISETPTHDLRNGETNLFLTSYPYMAGSLDVYFQGTKLREGVDFVEVDPQAGSFRVLDASGSGPSLYVTYERAGNVPTPGSETTYRPAPVLMYGWGTEFDSWNALFAASAMALDRHTQGTYTATTGTPRSTPPIHRNNQSEPGFGNLFGISQAWGNGWGETLHDPGIHSWSYFAAKIDEGRGSIIQGMYGALPANKRFADIDRLHALYINERLSDGSFWGYDPLRPAGVIYAAAELQDFTEALGFVNAGDVSAAFTQVTS